MNLRLFRANTGGPPEPKPPGLDCSGRTIRSGRTGQDPTDWTTSLDGLDWTARTGMNQLDWQDLPKLELTDRTGLAGTSKDWTGQDGHDKTDLHGIGTTELDGLDRASMDRRLQQVGCIFVWNWPNYRLLKDWIPTRGAAAKEVHQPW